MKKEYKVPEIEVLNVEDTAFCDGANKQTYNGVLRAFHAGCAVSTSNGVVTKITGLDECLHS